MSSWKNIFFIFSSTLWIVVGICFFSITFSIYYYSKYCQTQFDLFYAMLIALRINIGHMAGNSPKKFIGRIVFFLFLFYGIIVSSLFQSTTVSSMTTQYNKKRISTLSDAITNEYHFAGSNFSYTVLIHRSDKVKLFLFFFFFLINNCL